MEYKRSAGILLHPTSLPSRYCIGDLGRGAYEFIDYLEKAGARLWQILPLGPTGYGESPYSSTSTFAGNPYLISLDLLVEENLLGKNESENPPCSEESRVNFAVVRSWKMPRIEKAAVRFREGADSHEDYQAFCRNNAFWLEDFALFTALKTHFDKKAAAEGAADSRWNRYWDRDIALREASAVSRWKNKLSDKIEIIKVIQYFFHTQWKALKTYARGKGIKIIGDIPIFVSEESSDFWSRRDLYKADERGIPTVSSGVPPDYFSETGQNWGNPLYDWESHLKEKFSWWISRIRHLTTMVDIVRIDHFRGFEAYWEIPGGEITAVKGKWVKAPGKMLFKAVKEKLGDVAILAEDLGVITPEVNALRDTFSFPGMKVLQFAFERNRKGKLDTANIFLPLNYPVNSVVYTGTHDNDTTRGWYNSLSGEERDLVRRYLARPDNDIVWDLIREAMRSVAVLALFPMQDLLDLDNNGRMNLPSTVGEANWSWRMGFADLGDSTAFRFREMSELYGRIE